MHSARVAGGQIGRGGGKMLDDCVCSQWALATLVLTNLVECGSAVSIGLHCVYNYTGLHMGLDVFNAIFTKKLASCCFPFAIWVVYSFTGALSSQHFDPKL